MDRKCTAFEHETVETGAAGASIDPEQERVCRLVGLRLHEVVEVLQRVVLYTDVPSKKETHGPCQHYCQGPARAYIRNCPDQGAQILYIFFLQFVPPVCRSPSESDQFNWS